MQNNITPKRLIGPDMVRVLAMLMVVSIHTISNFTVRPDFFGTKLWFSLEPIAAISKASILLFFMLSGYLVLSRSRTIKENWLKTKKRILIPLLFFSVINLLYAFYKFNLNEISNLMFWQEQLVRITNFPSSPLWFLVVLFFFYLLNPVWQLIFSKNENKNIGLYITGLALGFSIFVTVIKFPSLKYDFFFNNFTGWLGYLFFYFYGGVVRNKWINIDNKLLNFSLFIIGFFLLMFGDFLNSYLNIHSIKFIWSGYFYEFLSIPNILMAIGLFNLLIKADYKWLTNNHTGNIILKIIQWIAGLSFGIYLIHTYVVSMFTDILNFDFNKLNINVYLYNILNFSLVLGISILITYLIIKTPKLKAIIGE